MEYYNLANTDLKISKIGLGCMRIANKTVEEVEVLVKDALDSGINLFDHADIYGKGKSEEIFGEVLKRHAEYREKMVIQTKCGIRPGIGFDFSCDYILESVDKALQRLQIDTIDILLLHRPDTLMDPQEVARAFDELKAKGKVRYFGVSNQTPLQMELLQKYCNVPLVINQIQISPLHAMVFDSGIYADMDNEYGKNQEAGILEYCRLHDIQIQAWSVIRKSLFEDTFIDNPKYPKLNSVLDDLGKKYNVSKAAIVSAWLLRHPAGIVPIIGTTSCKNLDATLPAIDVHLTRKEWYDIYQAEEKPLP